ncbi:MAG: DUF1998 domain-containing protein [Nitrosopumilus sp.]|nr:DUF1998 domain-containing protein [Nitrosopumilus sp.]
MTTQGIRPSQFILTYGPGAIIDTKVGPRIILDADIGLFKRFKAIDPELYRISNRRMSEGALDGANIYRIPTSSELDSMDAYQTRAFPEWKLCVRAHKGRGYLLYKRGSSKDSNACPSCGYTTAQEPVRFVRACSDGHIDDIDWYKNIHMGSTCDKNSSYYWRRTGSSMHNITIICTKCNKEKNFGAMYYAEDDCSGRHPQKESSQTAYDNIECKKGAKIIPRQASSLRVAETKTLLVIDSDIYTCLEEIYHDLRLYERTGNLNKENFKTIVDANREENKIDVHCARKLLSANWETICGELRTLHTLENKERLSYGKLIEDEFHVLEEASKHGAPPKKQENQVINFEVDKHDINDNVTTDNGLKFTITPIKKLTTVMVQKKFRREISDEGNNTPKEIDVSFNHKGAKWYPGVKYTGEGIFIRLTQGGEFPDSLKTPSFASWDEAHANSKRDEKYPQTVFREAEERNELHPGFVWWHTLAHLLIRIIGEESGYSSASIRERIYFERTKDGFNGGVLLYATDPGSEGTMGGLIGMATHMRDFLNAAFEAGAICSGDPLCAEASFKDGGYNGAACYACLLNSETSCEHRNMWLDRKVLGEIIQ